MNTEIRRQSLLGISIVFIGLGLLFGTTIVFSHEDKKNEVDAASTADSLSGESEPLDSIYAIINENYQSVRHIFEYSSFDCHSSSSNYPWYHEIPGIKGMIDEDIEEARNHFDLSDNFPFISEHSQLDLLKDIKEEIENDDMPLMSYRLMHWGRMIEDSRRDSVFDWIDASIALLMKTE
ncbi:MAG: heme-binding domain-containing protein [Candidatus Zixiibacteriota bacterium]